MSEVLNQRLIRLYDSDELCALLKVSDAMLADPTIFDTHSREVRNLPAESEQDNGKA